ncbi:hypothetical protein BH11MYX1_BH11MYX1_21700 [soil metagenome]
MLVLSCGSPAITPGGQTVTVLTRGEPAPRCRLVGEVQQGGFWDCARSEEPVRDALRNKAAHLGGDLVVIGPIELVNNEHGACFEGRGRAYLCGASGDRAPGSLP